MIFLPLIIYVFTLGWARSPRPHMSLLWLWQGDAALWLRGAGFSLWGLLWLQQGGAALWLWDAGFSLWGASLAAARGRRSLVAGCGFSVRGPLWLRSTGSKLRGLQMLRPAGSRAQAEGVVHGLRRPAANGTFLDQGWNLCHRQILNH